MGLRQPRTFFNGPLLSFLIAASVLARASQPKSHYSGQKQNPWVPFDPVYNYISSLPTHWYPVHGVNPYHYETTTIFPHLTVHPLNQQQIIHIHEAPSSNNVPEENIQELTESNKQTIINNLSVSGQDISDSSKVKDNKIQNEITTTPDDLINSELKYIDHDISASNNNCTNSISNCNISKNATENSIVDHNSRIVINSINSLENMYIDEKLNVSLEESSSKDEINFSLFNSTAECSDCKYETVNDEQLSASNLFVQQHSFNDTDYNVSTKGEESRKNKVTRMAYVDTNDAREDVRTFRRRNRRRPTKRRTTTPVYDDYDSRRRRRRPTRYKNKFQRRPITRDREYFDDYNYYDDNYSDEGNVFARQGTSTTESEEESTSESTSESTTTTTTTTTTTGNVTGGYTYGPPPQPGYGPSNGNENISITYGPPTGPKQDYLAPLLDAWYNQYSKGSVLRRLQELLQPNNFYNNQYDVNYHDNF